MCALPATPPATTDRLALVAKLFRGFADPSRLAILQALRDGERCVTDLIAATELPQSNVSNHLACLKDCGLVTARQNGRYVYYRLADPAVVAMLADADRVLARFAAHIAACTNYAPAGDVAPAPPSPRR